MRYLKSILAAVALIALAGTVSAQSPADTLNYGLFRGISRPVAFVRGADVAQVFATRTGPDSTPASTANADSVILPPIAIKGYGIRFDAFGTSAATHGKSVVVTFTGAGATTTVDSLQMKTGGGTWHVSCTLVIRNATSGAATGDSAQVLMCGHIGSADSSTTASASPLTTTVKAIASGTTNRFAIHNSTGTAVGDVIVTGITVLAFPGGRVNP